MYNVYNMYSVYKVVYRGGPATHKKTTYKKYITKKNNVKDFVSYKYIFQHEIVENQDLYLNKENFFKKLKILIFNVYFGRCLTKL